MNHEPLSTINHYEHLLYNHDEPAPAPPLQPRKTLATYNGPQLTSSGDAAAAQHPAPLRETAAGPFDGTRWPPTASQLANRVRNEEVSEF